MPPLPADLTLVAEHVGVRVLRGEGIFAKVHADPGRARREVALLQADLPLVTPRLLDHGDDWLVMEDARRDPRLRRLPADALPEAARLLARLHACTTPGLPLAPAAPEGLVLVGDALVHGDVHPSNWITRDGVPIGLLDWASARRSDPEEDLAGLVEYAPDALDTIAHAWEEEAGREVDRERILAWIGHEHGPAHGQIRTERAVPKPTSGERWAATDPGPIGRALRQPWVLGDAAITDVRAFGRHACNDVVRLSVDGAPRVVKVYNKPVPAWLFDLERHLARHLRGLRVLAPLPLRGGGDLFRVGPRLAALYEDAGDALLGNTTAELESVARALAALHAVAPPPVPEGLLPRPDWGLVEAALPPGAPDLRAAWERGLASTDGLPRALVHGSFHRDHLLVSPGGLTLFDLEKAAIGPRVLDVATTASFTGYRGNDERPDPRRIVAFVRAYHRALPLTPAEQAAFVPLLVGHLFEDLRALEQDGASPGARLRHARIIDEFDHNRDHLARALRRYLHGG